MLRATIRAIVGFIILMNTSTKTSAQASCAGASTLTPSLTCTPVSGNLKNAVSATPVPTCGSGSAFSVWYKFTANSPSAIITIDNFGSGLTGVYTPYLQIFSGACGSLSPLSCVQASSTSASITQTGLNSNGSTVYYVRVYTTTQGTTNPTNKWDFDICVQSSPNDECITAVTLTSATSCSNTAGTLVLSTETSGLTADCEAVGVHNDVWYSFVAASASQTVTISSLGSNFTNPAVQLYSGNCGVVLSSVECGTTTFTASGLTISNTYFIRVSNIGSSPATNGTFNICVTHPSPPPANNECAGAVTLANNVTNSAGTVWAATASSGIPVGCATGNPDDDVWYKFTPSQIMLNITLSSIGSNLSTSGAMLQLFSGTCGTLTSIACGTTSIVTSVTSGATYYIRVYSLGAGSIGGTAPGSAFSITASATAQVTVTSGRMKEVFQQSILSASNILLDPWEVTYGTDNYLWITEAKGYKVYRMHPQTGIKTTVLDVSQNSTFFSLPADQAFYVQFPSTQNPWPQGGMAGLALHPKFMDATAPENYVYVSYVHSYNGGSSPNGIFFTNRLVRFTYNTSTGLLESPVSLCDTLRGSSDHNSQRIIIAPVAGTHYLFYGSGDMGAGQFANQWRPMKAQDSTSYEGKILRFNLVEDGDANAYQKWIPNDNPYAQSAVWCIGIRNNQGFAYDSTNGLLYGSSHGPYSDDEINIIRKYKNYGHPLVIGFAADNNYNTSSAGSPNTTSSCPIINNEQNSADSINATVYAEYSDPLFTAYAQTQAIIHNIWLTNPSNGGWPSEGWSGLDFYDNTIVPGWKNSLVVSSLKWGRLLRLKLGPGGTSIVPTNGSDTVSYFGSQNRFRDISFAPNGKEMYVIMDRSSTTSGPSSGNPIVPTCAGCLQKYIFLGYADAAGKSTIPTAIDVTVGTANTCNTGTTITIDNTNNNLWVPITGPDGNIMAEIHAAGQNLGTVTSSFYTNSGAIRNRSGVYYLDRNITITPQNQPGSPVKIRLYIAKSEFDALDAHPLGGVAAIGDLKILKNSDACLNASSANTTVITPLYAEAHGANGYMLQGSITSFSSFYFASSNFILPVNLLSFTGSLQTNNTSLLKWTTANEINAAHFVVERSLDGTNFMGIGTVTANGNSTSVLNYSLVDNNAANQPVSVLYYRLRMVDIDGSARYSQVITISLASITGKIIVSPNPVRTEATINFTTASDGLVKWQLIDNSGRFILNDQVQVSRGIPNSFNIDMKTIASGTYYLKVRGAGIDQRIKVQKL